MIFTVLVKTKLLCLSDSELNRKFPKRPAQTSVSKSLRKISLNSNSVGN